MYNSKNKAIMIIEYLFIDQVPTHNFKQIVSIVKIYLKTRVLVRFMKDKHNTFLKAILPLKHN